MDNQDKPTLHIDNNGNKSWILNGEFHRLDGPAVEYIDGSVIWYRKHVIHRDDGPAVSWAFSCDMWYHSGRIHRIDGPAIIHKNGDAVWFIWGRKYDTEKEFNKALERLISFDTIKW